MLRSVMAIVAGFLFIGALSFGMDLALHRLIPARFDANGGTTDTLLLLFIIAYVGVFAVTGCYLAARWAGHAPMRHALLLGVLGLIFTGIGTYASWNTAPAWYHVVSLLLVMPFAWLGGRLYQSRHPHAP